MSLDTGLLLCFLWGGIVHADSEAAWQMMISQPLVCCTVAGAILGDIQLGLTVGILLELPFLAEFPAGGSKVSMISLGSLISTMLAIRLSAVTDFTDTALAMSLLSGILISWVCADIKKWTNHLNLFLVDRAERAARNGNLGLITAINYAGVLAALLFGAAFSCLFYFLAQYPLVASIEYFGQHLESNLFFVKPVLLGVGFGALFRVFRLRRTYKSVFAGATLTFALLLAIF